MIGQLPKVKVQPFTPKESGDTTPVPDNPTNITMVMYVDDGKIYVSSKSFDMNITLLATAYHRADDWLRKAGLSADFSKRELMHYSRRRGDNSSPSSGKTLIADLWK
jgi:hypothetical protein